MSCERVLIVGVGYTGSRLLGRLDTAVGLSRSAVPGTGNRFVVDLDDADATAIESQPGDKVVYTVPPARDADNDLRLERFLDRLSNAPARIVYLGTSGVYGNHDGATVTEDTPVNPSTDRARRRVAAEQTLARWCAGSGAEFVGLRVPGIYGPGRLGTDRLGAGTTVIRESEAGPGNRIHVDDLASAAIAALSDAAPAGIYNVGDGDYRSSTWFLNEVARQAGLPAPHEISRDEAFETFSPMRLSFLRESRRVDVGRMRDILRPEFAYADPAAGIAASLAEEKSVAGKLSE